MMIPTRHGFLLIALTLLSASTAKTASVTNGTDSDTLATIVNFRTSQVNQTNPNEISTKIDLQNASELSIWPFVENFWDWLSKDLSESSEIDGRQEGRTFGKLRRMQMALIPFAFKFGVMSAMITFLILLSMKTVFLLKALLLINLIALFAKFFTFKHSSHEYEIPHYAPQWGGGYASGGWNSVPTARIDDSLHTNRITPSNKEIHLHIYGASVATGQSPQYEVNSQQQWARSDPYSSYDPRTNDEQAGEELFNGAPGYSQSYAKQN